MENNTYIECAMIINTHGVKGGLKLDSWCNTPEDLAALKRLFLKEGDSYREMRVRRTSVFKRFVIAELYGVEDMDSAIALKNKVLYANRADFKLEDGEYFISDLVGLPVIDADSGKVYGKLLETINRGASDIYVVKTANGERMMPAVKEFVKRVDLESGVYVEVIPGLLTDD